MSLSRTPPATGLGPQSLPSGRSQGSATIPAGWELGRNARRPTGTRTRPATQSRLRRANGRGQLRGRAAHVSGASQYELPTSSPRSLQSRRSNAYAAATHLLEISLAQVAEPRSEE